jgi:hypothetical protein
MQVIEPTELDVEGYVREQWHLKVRPRECCVGCGKAAKQHRHGVYWRDVVSRAGRLVTIAVARFLCTACGMTTSHLPKFALTYRLLGASSLEAFVSGGNRPIRRPATLGSAGAVCPAADGLRGGFDRPSGNGSGVRRRRTRATAARQRWLGG